MKTPLKNYMYLTHLFGIWCESIENQLFFLRNLNFYVSMQLTDDNNNNRQSMIPRLTLTFVKWAENYLGDVFLVKTSFKKTFSRSLIWLFTIIIAECGSQPQSQRRRSIRRQTSSIHCSLHVWSFGYGLIVRWKSKLLVSIKFP